MDVYQCIPMHTNRHKYAQMQVYGKSSITTKHKKIHINIKRVLGVPIPRGWCVKNSLRIKKETEKHNTLLIKLSYKRL